MILLCNIDVVTLYLIYLLQFLQFKLEKIKNKIIPFEKFFMLIHSIFVKSNSHEKNGKKKHNKKI